MYFVYDFQFLLSMILQVYKFYWVKVEMGWIWDQNERASKFWVFEPLMEVYSRDEE